MEEQPEYFRALRLGGSWMSEEGKPLDLVCLVADVAIKKTIEALLERHQAMAIRPVRYERIFVHPERDPGCLQSAEDYLRGFSTTADHALVIFDRDGCGKENQSREDIEMTVEERLARNGWDDRATVIVIDPELEAWVWSDSPHVASVLGWDREGDLRQWLTDKKTVFSSENGKPKLPKEAMEKVIRETRTPDSAILRQRLAKKVSFKRCTDPAFQKLCRTLQSWFPIGSS